MSSPVFRASSKGDANKLSRLIDKGADVNARLRDGLTPLMMATLINNTAASELLIEHGADINARDNNGNTALTFALDRSLLRAMMTRLKYKFRSMSSNQDVYIRYSYLQSTFNNTIAKVLISKGADVNHVYAHDMTPLMCAVLSGNDEMVELLLAKGADVNAKTNDGDSPLMFAAYKGYFNIVNLLIEHGADVNNTNNIGQAVLTMASCKNDPSIMQLLRDKGATGLISSCGLKNKK